MTAREFVLSSFDWRDSRFARDKGAQAFAEAYSQAENERLRKAAERACERLGMLSSHRQNETIPCEYCELSAALRPEQRKDGEND